MKGPFLIAGVSLVVLAHAGTAAAATAFVAPSDTAPEGKAVRYIADAGETNRVTVTGSDSETNVEITDGGATISAGPGCTSLAPNKVACDFLITFDVELGDGNDRLSLNVESAESVLRGGDGNDRILGGNFVWFPEYLVGGRGNDVLRGRSGVDILNGGPGADTFIEALVGGRGNDVLGGTTTNFDGLRLVGMHLEGRRGNDVLRGGRARDTLLGGRGDDVLRGSGRADRMLGSRGNDRLIGGSGSDEMAGRRGNDLLRGGSGRDRLSGGIGRDLLLARDGRADRLNGGSWKDSARIDRGLDRVRRIETILP